MSRSIWVGLVVVSGGGSSGLLFLGKRSKLTLQQDAGPSQPYHHGAQALSRQWSLRRELQDNKTSSNAAYAKLFSLVALNYRPCQLRFLAPRRPQTLQPQPQLPIQPRHDPLPQPPQTRIFPPDPHLKLPITRNGKPSKACFPHPAYRHSWVLWA